MEVVTKEKKNNRERSPLVGKIKVCDLKAVPACLEKEECNLQAVGMGKREQKRKNGFYRTVLNTCLSFLNEAVRIRAVGTSINYSNLCTPTAPFTSSMTAGDFFLCIKLLKPSMYE